MRTHADEKRAIVMVSAGRDRPWAAAVAELAALYAKTCDAHFCLVDHLPSPEQLPLGRLPEAPGRRNKLAYASKCYFPWLYMTELGFDRVLVIDDTCCIRPSCPDIFDIVPRQAVGFTRTSSAHFAASVETIREVFPEEEHVFRKGRYMNGGWVLYHAGMAPAIAPDRIARAGGLLFAKFPQQTLLLYLLHDSGTAMHEVGKPFNRTLGHQKPLSERSRIVDPEPFVDAETYVYHVTSAFRNRDALIRRLCRLFRAEWAAGREHPLDVVP